MRSKCSVNIGITVWISCRLLKAGVGFKLPFSYLSVLGIYILGSDASDSKYLTVKVFFKNSVFQCKYHLCVAAHTGLVSYLFIHLKVLFYDSNLIQLNGSYERGLGPQKEKKNRKDFFLIKFPFRVLNQNFKLKFLSWTFRFEFQNFDLNFKISTSFLKSQTLILISKC